MIVVGGPAHSQIQPVYKGSILPDLQKIKDKPLSIISLTQPVKTLLYKPILAPDFYSKQLGFFCRQEIKMDKAIKIPFRFRLGSVEQCNWLEGKRR